MKKLVLSALFLILSSSCTKNSNDGGQNAPGAREVNIAAWSNYLEPALLQVFEKKTGIKVNVSNYSSNEELVAKLQAGATGYDVAMPSDYMVFAMVKLGLLKELQYDKIPNSKALNTDLLKKSFDSTNKYSLPFDWGTTGIAYNKALYPKGVKGWADLFNNNELAGKFTLLDDVRETLGAALKSAGLSLNSKNSQDLQRAKEILLKVKPRLKGFTSEPLVALVNGEVAAAHIYSSDALRARKKTDGKVQYLFPDDGCTIWIDNLVIPTGAKNVNEAHELINFLLDAKSNVTTASLVFVIPSNKEALALLPAELKNDPAVFPDKARTAKCEMLEDLGDTLQTWDRVWTEVKTGI